MTISSVSSVTPTTTTSPIATLQSTSSTDPTDSGTSVAASSNFSTMGQLMSQLQSLEQTDPDKAKTVLAKIGSDLQSTNPTLASKFTQASQTGDLSALQPKGASGGHHHHHHGGGGGAGASPSTQASSYDQSSDPMAEIESVISSALQGT
jgi:hypothetical protein